MPKMPAEKRKRLEEFNKNYDNIAAMPDYQREFLNHAAEQRVNMVSMQNLSWMGFFRAPFSQNFANSDIVIAGAGGDYGTLSETGNMRHAPMYLRDQSRKLIPILTEWECSPFTSVRVSDMGDVDVFGLNYGQQLDHIGSWLSQAARAGNLLLTFGGEHSLGHASHEALEILSETHFDGTPCGGIIFDGHTDLMPEGGMGECTDEPRENANFMAAAFARGIIDPDRWVCAGIRENGAGGLSGHEIARDLGIPVITPRMVQDKGAQYWADFVHERVSGGPTIIECDLDGLDPVLSGGGFSTRDGFGLSWREYQTISRGLRGTDLVYASIVEYSPAHDPTRATATNATHLGFEYLCMLTETKLKLNGGKKRPTVWKNSLSTSAGYFRG